jgi:hypothetical protein
MQCVTESVRWLLTTFSEALVLGLSAYFGARFAYGFNIKRSEDLSKKEDIESANQVMFGLLQQLNSLALYKNDFLDDIRESKGRHIELRPLIPDATWPNKLSLDSLTFLMAPEHMDILIELSFQQERYETIVRLLKFHSKESLDNVQPRLERLGVSQGDVITGDQIEAAIGNRM